MPETLWDEPAGAAPALRAWPTGLELVAQGWQPLLQDFLRSADGQRLGAALQAQLAAGATIYPPQPLRALQLTPPEAVRVVILGQDPYHGPGQANGLAFAVAPGLRLPPSLRNIYKELQREYGAPPRPEGLLDHWARQGVLLLNTSLTVQSGHAGSHARLGWQALTDAIVLHLAESRRELAFLLWGAHAQAKLALITAESELHPVLLARHPMARPPRPSHLVLTANHPSPLSALRPPLPFIGCGHFRQVDAFLRAQGRAPIDWLGATW